MNSNNPNLHNEGMHTTRRRDGGVQLSEEDERALKELRQEAAMKRGYPLGFLFGGAAYFTLAKKLPNMNHLGKIGIVTTTSVFGFLAGQFSYIPVAVQKLESQLPFDSPLRQILEKRRLERLQSPQRQTTSPVQQQPAQLPPMYNDRDVTENQPDLNIEQEAVPAAEKKTYTYEDLRKLHRQTEKNKVANRHPTSTNEVPQTGYNDSYNDNSFPASSNTKKRYNKYGDEIIE